MVHHLAPTAPGQVKRVLISTTDTTGLPHLATQLVRQYHVEIFATEGTANFLKKHNINPHPVSSITGQISMLGGRVKTLHPHIHAALLADRANPVHMAELHHHNLAPFDAVIINLYAFTETPSVENIDIGGVALLRAAAKNHTSIAALCKPDQYDGLLAELDANQGHTTAAYRKQMAATAFKHVAAYDQTIGNWLS